MADFTYNDCHQGIRSFVALIEEHGPIVSKLKADGSVSQTSDTRVEVLPQTSAVLSEYVLRPTSEKLEPRLRDFLGDIQACSGDFRVTIMSLKFLLEKEPRLQGEPIAGIVFQRHVVPALN